MVHKHSSTAPLADHSQARSAKVARVSQLKPDNLSRGSAEIENEPGDGTVIVPHATLIRLRQHLADAYTHYPTRKVRQAILLTEHLLNIRT